MPWQKLVLAYGLGIWSLKYPWPGLTCLILVFLFLPFKRPLFNVLAAALFCSGLGTAWFSLPELPEKIPEEIKTGQKVVVQGKVGKSTFLPGKRQRIVLEDLFLGRGEEQRELYGNLVWTWQEGDKFLYPGQSIKAHLKVKPVHGLANFGVWNSEFFWRIQNVHWRAYTRGEHFWHKVHGLPGAGNTSRQRLKQRVLQGFELHGQDLDRQVQVQALGLALLFGDRYLMSPELLEQIRLSSLSHSLALSGMHLGVITGLGFLLAAAAGSVCPRIYLYLPYAKLGVVTAAPLCLLYIWMGQAPPTLIRSGIMFASWGLLLFLNRKRVLVDGLFLAAGIIILADPWAVFDLRLQLSLAAVAGIGFCLPVIDRFLKQLDLVQKNRLLRYFCTLAGVTLAANLALLPVQAWTFNYLSPHVYLNLLWLPVLGLGVLPAGFAGLFISLIPGMKILGGILMEIAAGILNVFISGLNFLDEMGLLHPVITPRPGWEHILVYWILILLVLYRKKLNLKNRMTLAGLGLVLILAALPLVKTPGNKGLRVRILDTGHGQGMILELPDSKRMLIDGGGSWNPEYDLGRRLVTPALTWRKFPERLDAIIMTHPHVDHYGGLIYPLQYMGAEIFMHNGLWPQERDRFRIRQALDRQNVSSRPLARGEVLDLGGGAALEVLHPEDPGEYESINDSSLVFRLVWQGKGLVLMPGDLEARGLERLVQSGQDLSSQVVLIPHHGSRHSAAPRLYELAEPEIAVVSRGFMNRFGFPHPEVLEIIEKRGIQVLDTAVHGEVVLTWPDWKSRPLTAWARSRTGPGGIPWWF